MKENFSNEMVSGRLKSAIPQPTKVGDTRPTEVGDTYRDDAERQIRG